MTIVEMTVMLQREITVKVRRMTVVEVVENFAAAVGDSCCCC